MALSGIVMGFVSLAFAVFGLPICLIFIVLLALLGVAISSFDADLPNSPLVSQLEGDPAIVEHVGDIESCSLDFEVMISAAGTAE